MSLGYCVMTSDLGIHPCDSCTKISLCPKGLYPYLVSALSHSPSPGAQLLHLVNGHTPSWCSK